MNFDELWEELRAENPELIDKADRCVAEILSRKKQRGCPPDRNPGFCDDPDEEICDSCWADWEKRKPKPSNADKIRSMSDEDMASKIVSFRCPYKVCFPEGGENCKKCWLDWLRQEVSDEP